MAAIGPDDLERIAILVDAADFLDHGMAKVASLAALPRMPVQDGGGACLASRQVVEMGSFHDLLLAVREQQPDYQCH